jgi:pimeloyl-ACP methyl ester carboxylesterase
MMNIKIKNKSGDTINMDLRFPPDSGNKIPLLVFCHGFKGFKDWGCFPYMMNRFSESGFFTVSFNFSFNGTDNEKDNPVDFERLDLFAKNTFSKELDDLDCVLDFLEDSQEKYNYDFSRLTLAGHSRGGGIAILKAAEDARIKNLVTLASVAEFGRYGEETKRMWRKKGFIEALNTRTKQKMRMNITLLEDIENNNERLNIVKAVSKLNIPFLIIHGTEDLAVDMGEAETLYTNCPSPNKKLIILEKAGHTFGAVHPFAGTTPHLETVIGEIISFAKK